MKLRRTTRTTATALGIVIGVLGRRAGAEPPAPGEYETLPGASVVEIGDRVPMGRRVVPLSATLRIESGAGASSLVAVIQTAVLEGDDPFPLTVRSSSGAQLPDGTIRFAGDYLRDLYPSGTQYLFDWSFAAAANGSAVWNGSTFWAGGHIWIVEITNVAIVPRPALAITPAAPGLAISWPVTSHAYVLEQAATLPAAKGDWSAVTNAVSVHEDHYEVAVEAAAARGFFRLRRN